MNTLHVFLQSKCRPSCHIERNDTISVRAATGGSAIGVAEYNGEFSMWARKGHGPITKINRLSRDACLAGLEEAIDFVEVGDDGTYVLK